MRYHAETTIAAPPETVWRLLTDAAAYPRWNETVVRVEGEIALGRTIKVFAAISPKRAFPVKVTTLEPARRMTWQGGMPLGLFRGVRTFDLTPTGDGGTRFAMSEVFSGPLLGLIRRSMPDLQPSFDEFAACLARAATR